MRRHPHTVSRSRRPALGLAQAALAALLIACGTNEAPPEAGPEDTSTVDTGPPAEPVWPEDMLAILTPGCGGCHGIDACSTQRCFLDTYEALLDPAAVVGCAEQNVGECIVTRIHDGSMPPGGCTPGNPGCITVEDMEALEAWVDAGMPPAEG